MTLTEDEARSIILTRHGLTHGGRYPDAASAMKALVAVQTQYPASLAPALAARAEKVTARSVEQALSKNKIFLKGWNLRCTVHTSLAEDHMLMLRAGGAYFASRHAAWIGSHGIDQPRIDELHGRILNELSQGPLPRRVLHERIDFYKALPMVGWGLDVMGVALEGKVVFSHQAAARTEFARVDQWAPHVSLCELSDFEAKKELMRRYFASYGPATFADFLYWTGMKTMNAKAAFEEAREELTEVKIEGRKSAHFVYGSLPKPAKPAVRLLPKFDPLMMGHRDKTLFVPETIRDRVFRKAGQVEAVVLAEGRVQAGWRTVRRGSILEFVIEPFGPMKKSWLPAIEREALRTAKSLGFKEAIVKVKE